MVEMGLIRKAGLTGVPLLLGANTLTETGRDRNAIPSTKRAFSRIASGDWSPRRMIRPS
jgi:hypothetical protein